MESKKIKEIREKLGLSQENFAEMLGVHYKTIQNYEKGGKIPKSKIPFLQIIEKQIELGSVNNSTNANNNVNSHINQNSLDVIMELQKSYQAMIAKRDEQIDKLIELLTKK